jgi:hypothetical protein
VQGNAVSLLTAWVNFYVIIGSSAAALTGLVFVVITLIARTRLRANGGIETFSTPTIVYFCTALLIAAILSAPWQALVPVALLLGLAGLAGIAYVVIVLLRARRLTFYNLVLEDWLWHLIFPFIAYLALVVAALILPSNAVPALFCIGAVTVLLLFIGIHNAWDNVTYIVVEYFQPEKKDSQDDVSLRRHDV